MTTLLDSFAELFGPNGTVYRSFVPAADVVVTDDDVTVIMDVPGLKVDDVTIELIGDTLTVRGERAFPYGDDEGRTWQRVERGFGKFERVLRVPAGLDPEQITASMADGVLTLHIPKPESRKPRRIQITTNGQPALEQNTDERELAGAAA